MTSHSPVPPSPPGTLEARVSLFSSAMAVDVECILSLHEILHHIRSGRWAAPVAAVRAALARGDRRQADQLKKRLPAFTASALLSTRARHPAPSDSSSSSDPSPSSDSSTPRLLSPTGWLQADFDAKDHPGLSQDHARLALQGDPCVGAVFVGPSGGGIKALVRIHPARHADSVAAAAAHFRDRHGLRMDPACKDVERLCFISHDPHAWTREGETRPLPLPAAPLRAEPATNTSPASPNTPPPPGPQLPAPAPWTVDDVREILSYLPRQRPDYDTWLRVISGVSTILPMAEAIAVLSEWMPPETPGEYEAKWRHRLHQVTMRTVIRMAQVHGFDARAAARRQRWLGRMPLTPLIRAAHPDNSAPAPATDPDTLLHADLLTEDPVPALPDLLETWQHLQDQQLGDATLFSARLGHVWRYDLLLQNWRRYHPHTGLWTRDPAGTVTLEARYAAADSYALLIDTLSREKAAAATPEETKRLDSELREVQARMANLGKSAWCAGVMSFAEKMPALLCRAPEFDRHRHLLALANGVVDFNTNQCTSFDPAHNLSLAAPVVYDPEATCPAFDAFLHTCMGGDEALIAYLWRAIGYSLTGFVDHDALFFCHGTGANGKSTFFLVLRMLLGDDLSTVIDISTLLGGSQETSSTQDYKKSMLEGKRLIMTDEIPDDRRFNESMVKQLLGGEDIVARRPYEMPYTFAPTHKIWAVGNHKPRIKGTDHGIWRRIHLIPWLVTIPPEARKPRHELIRTFRAELPGILNRALAGYGDFQKLQGLAPPPAVLAATEEYRQEEDTLAAYLSERLLPDPDGRVKVTTLLQDYRSWCKDGNGDPITSSARKFTSLLKMQKLRLEPWGQGATMHLFGFRMPADPQAKFTSPVQQEMLV